MSETRYSTQTFGTRGEGKIYICGGNSVYTVVPSVPWDINGDGVSDLCRCPADWDGDGAINSEDIGFFLEAWLESVTEGTQAADYDRSSATNSADISAFLVSWPAALGGGC